MLRAPVALLLVALASAGAAAGQRQLPPRDVDFVEIDAVVVDKRGQPIHGLHASDFTVKEDGTPMMVTTFREVAGPVPGDPDTARTVVLLLDDAGVLSTGTQTLQTVARGFVESAAPLDEMPVIRLHTEAGDQDRQLGIEGFFAVSVRGHRYILSEVNDSLTILRAMRDMSIGSNRRK